MPIRITRRNMRRGGKIILVFVEIWALYFDVTTLEGTVSVVIAVLATVALGVTIVSLLWHPIIRRQLLKRSFHGVEIFEMRQGTPDFQDEIKKPECRYIWALWHSGSIANRQHTDISKFHRLILLQEDEAGLKTIADMANTTTTSLSQDIRMLSDKMLSSEDNRKRIRWLKPMPINLMTFYNPEDKDGWVFLQHFVPFEIANDRLCFIVRRQDNRRLYERLKKAYDELWNSLECVD